MLKKTFFVFVVLIKWILKCSSLPKLYHKICNERGLPVSVLRNFEKQGHKLVKLKLDVKYFENCLDLNLCPEFLRFKTPNLNVFKNNKDLYLTVVRKKLAEIKSTKKVAETKFNSQKNYIFSRISFIQKLCLIKFLNQEFQKEATTHIKVHEKKLLNLWKKQSDRCPDCLTNLSSKNLNLKEINALKFGLNNPILPKKVDKNEMKTNIEKLIYSLKKNTNLNIDDETKDEIKYLVKKFVEKGNRICSSRANQCLHSTLNKLSKDSTIKICKYDKGNGVAILNSGDYYRKLDNIIEDKTKFIEINHNLKNVHPCLQKESSISYYVRKYLKKIENSSSLIPSGSQPGKLYGMAKIHKQNVPLRPVVSMIQTPEYHLAKFLDSIIKPYIPDKYLLRSTEEFIEKLKQIPCNNSKTVVSFDVVSLYTNVPLTETIDIIIECLYSDENPNTIPIKKSIFRKLLLIATQGIFLYKDKLYKQVDGVTMGSPLGPTIANFFMGHLEEKIFSDSSNNLPCLYLRYIDDVYAVFDNQISSSKFLNVLNSMHKNIKFTIEKATDKLSFLDVQINFNEKGHTTTVYRKPTHTGLFLNFNSMCPKTWKSGLIMCLLHRAKVICSENDLFVKEVEKLKKLFNSNGYSNWFIDKTIKKFKDRGNLPNTEKEKKDFLFNIGIPYFGKVSNNFAKQLSNLIKKNFKVDINVYYKTIKTGSYFQLKCCTPDYLISNVVYLFKCSCDTSVSYIGMTSRHLSVRIREHINLESTLKSAIKDHLLLCNICKNNCSNSNFKILKKCKSEYDTKIHEALFIKKLNPQLNTQVFASGSSFLLNVY